MKLITENKIKKIECDAAPDGTIDKLEEKFVDKQIREYQYTVDTFTRRLADAQNKLAKLEAGEEYDRAVEEIESLERNLIKCKKTLNQYQQMKGLFV